MELSYGTSDFFVQISIIKRTALAYERMQLYQIQKAKGFRNQMLFLVMQSISDKEKLDQCMYL